MKIHSTRIDEALWEEASETRRKEWQTHIEDLEQGGDPEGDPYKLEIRATSYEAELRFIGKENFAITLKREDFESIVDEYLDTMKQISEAQGGGNIDRVEALDMAKKVTHDRASRLLRRQLSELNIDHEGGRRLFTLIFAIWVDTSLIALKHPRPTSEER